MFRRFQVRGRSRCNHRERVAGDTVTVTSAVNGVLELARSSVSFFVAATPVTTTAIHESTAAAAAGASRSTTESRLSVRFPPDAFRERSLEPVV